MRDTLYDGRGSDPELEALEATLRPLRFDRAPPSLDELPVRAPPQLPTLPSSLDDAWMLPPRPSASPELQRRSPPPPAVSPMGAPPASPRPTLREAVARRRGLLVGVAAVLVGASSFSLQRHWELEAGRGAAEAGGAALILVTARDVSAGAVLSADMFETRALPERFLTPAVVRAEALLPSALARSPVGDRLLLPLQAGEPLLWSQLESTPKAQQLSSRVLRGARAVAVATSHAAASGARTAERIDLVAALVDPRSGQAVAVTVVQNAVVLAASAQATMSGAGGSLAAGAGAGALAVLVSPEEAELLALAQYTGSLTPSSRHPDDFKVSDARPAVSLPEFLSGQRSMEREARRLRSIGAIRAETVPPAPGGLAGPTSR